MANIKQKAAIEALNVQIARVNQMQLLDILVPTMEK